MYVCTYIYMYMYYLGVIVYVYNILFGENNVVF